MNIFYKSALLVIISTTFFLQSCGTTEPIDSNGTPPDTTSNSFVWQKYTFGGGGGSSVLHDVAVINDTNIWAVGEIYMKDSLGNDDPYAYNLARWDGKKWSIKKISFTNSQGQTFLTPIQSIFAFSASNVWLGLDQLIHWDGTYFNDYEISTNIFHSWINKIWGTSSNDVYIVGNSGSIAHLYNGTVQKIESGTSLDIQDIWGEVDTKTNQTTVLAVASLLNYGRALNLLQIKNNSVTMLDTTGLHVNQHSLWFQTDKVFYVVGNGVYKKNSLSDIKWVQENGHPFLYKEAIRGNNWNDLFIVGDFGLVSHYNGSSWKHYDMSLPNANFYSVSVKGNTVAAVGQDGNNAVITIGRRN
ncbi:MAG: glucosyl transferase [Bacteroidetes bacterium]|nr:glucosyl transferase [Bacteroidota bacterium]